MNIADKVIRDLFAPNACFRVPLYQRRYEWDDKQRHQLWIDLLTTIEKRHSDLESEAVYKHFFGSIVLRKSSTSELAITFDVIDGQQRLTTLFLLLRAVYEVCRDPFPLFGTAKVPDALVQLPSLLSLGRADSSDTYSSRLQLSQLDQTEFRWIIRLSVGTESEKPKGLLAEAYRNYQSCFRNWLTEYREDQRSDQTDGLISCLMDGFTVAVIELTGEENDYQAFESLNTRGTPLSESDKVKNLCFMSIDQTPDAAESFYVDHWHPMELNLRPPVPKQGRPVQLLDEFMRYWTVMRTGTSFTKSALYDQTRALILKEIKKRGGGRIGRDMTTKCAVVDYFTEMAAYAPAFSVAEWPGVQGLFPLDRRILDRIATLTGDLGLQRSAHPLFLCLLKRYMDGDCKDSDALLRTLSVVESYVVRRAICGIDTKAQQSVFIRVSSSAYQCGDDWNEIEESVVSELKSFEQGTSAAWPDDTALRLGILHRPYELNNAEASLLRWVFGRFEEYTAGGELPPNLNSAKIVRIAAPAEQALGDIPTLAGIALISGQSSCLPIGNWHKLAAGSPFLLTRQIADSHDWGDDELEKRGTQLYKLACAVWPWGHPQSVDVPSPYRLTVAVDAENADSPQVPESTPKAPGLACSETNVDNPLDAQRKPTVTALDISENQRGISYQVLFGPYIRDARSIKLIDPYVRMDHQLRNLLSFVAMVTPSQGHTKLHLVTSSESAVDEERISRNFSDMQNDLAKHRVVFSFEFKKGIHDRSIETDTGWIISLSRGLDIFQQPDGRYTLSASDDLKRRCRATTIHYRRVPVD